MKTKILNRKYRLHQKIKKLYRYQSATKTIFVPYDNDLLNKDLQELQNAYNYSIQLEIPTL